MREFGSFAEADDAGNVLRARAETALMMAAIKKLAKPRAATDVQRANAFRCVKFVTGNGEQVDSENVDVERNFSGRLHCVCVEVDIVLNGDAADFFERLNCAKFVVGMHHGD